MQKAKRRLLYILLLLLIPISVAAQDVLIQNGCRRGRASMQKNSLRRSAQPRTPGGDYYKGERHQLVILAAFSDYAFKGDEQATLEQWDKIFNQEDFSESPFTGSIHDYFFDQSYGNFNLIFDLEYIQLGQRSRYRSTDEDDENSQFLVQDIVEELKNRNIEWSLYDWNNDGFINQLLIVYAGKGMNDGGDSNSIWPHQWWLSEHIDPTTGKCCETCIVSKDDMNYQIDCYCAVQELSSVGNYGSFGTICHEYTHCFGFPDFYYNTSFGSVKVVGAWDLMDYGNYNGSGFTPCGYSAHEKMLMQWLTPTELNSAKTITDLEPLSDKPQAYLIRNDGYENEFYMVEHRQQQGWDVKVPGNGIVIFHIDYDPDLWTGILKDEEGYMLPVNTGTKKRYNIFPANNSTSSYSGWAYPYSGSSNNELTNTSAPKASLNNENSDGTYLMSKPLTNMNVTDGKASFDFMGGTTAIKPISTIPAKAYTILYRIGPVSIIRYEDGTIDKVIK